jgi:hypothetical protein
MATPMYRTEKQMSNEDKEVRDTLFLLGGLSLMLFGAGLVITNPTVRRYLSQASVGGVGDLVQMALPDLERYLKMRSM